MKTFSILTPILLEHNYINFFVEYHLNLGFNKIYLLVDNYNIVQDEYIINNKSLLDKIVFLDTRNYSNKITHNGCHTNYIHSVLQYIYQTEVFEDYTILLGGDSFLFLNNLTIQEYLIKKNITDDISLIFFKWLVIYNKKYKPTHNIIENINSSEKNKIFDSHVFTLAKRSDVICPSDDSHWYKMKNENFNVFLNDKIFNLNRSISTHDIFNHTGGNSRADEYIYHFQSRDLMDSLVKALYHWNVDKNKMIQNIRILILENKIEAHNYLNLRLCSTIICFSNILVVENNNNIVNNNYTINTKVYDELLSLANLNEEEINSFLIRNNYIIN